MWSISEVKQIGKSAFRANYWPCVGAAFILGLLTTSFTVTRRIGPSVHSGQSADIDVNSAANCLAGLPAWVWILAAGLSRRLGRGEAPPEGLHNKLIIKGDSNE